MAALVRIPSTPSAPALVCALRVPATMRSLIFLRHALAVTLHREAWPGESSSRMMLAAGEAVINAIEHGSTSEGSVVVEIALRGDHAHLSVTDTGRPDVPHPVVPADPTPPPPTSIRGRGLVIMRGLADTFEVETNANGTRVSMDFRRDCSDTESLAAR